MDSLVNNYIAYTVNTRLEDIKNFEVEKYSSSRVPFVYSILFYHTNSILVTKVILIKEKKKWKIDKIGNFEFL